MGRCIDITGLHVNHITVLERAGSKGGQTLWKCQCSCGKIFLQTGGNLRSGRVKSCGHVRDDKAERQRIAHRTIAKKKHGDSFSRLYFVWLDIRRRCDSPNNISYHHYGGRGIKVCPEWDKDYNAFKEWAMENGYNPNAARGQCTIDRIDPDGDYCPENCRWSSMTEQSNNRRNSYRITYNGETHTAHEWQDITGIPMGTIYHRYKAGWPVEKIFSTIKYGQHGEEKGRY